MDRDMYRFQKTRGLLPAEHLTAFAAWLALRLGYRLDSSVFTHVRDVPGGGTRVEAKLRGIKGHRGELGEPGGKGGSYGGPRGMPGMPGLQGPKGPAGVIKGAKGTPGADGVDSLVNGVDGVDGVDGIPSYEPGDPGDPGPSKGPPGNQGVDGNPGTDAEGPPLVGPPGADGGRIDVVITAGSRGPMGAQGEPGDPADKFAIVPVQLPSTTVNNCKPPSTFYVGLFATEARAVIFEAVLRFTLPPRTRHHFRNLDPLYLDAVERDTLVIIGLTSSEPVTVEAKLDGNALIIDLPSMPLAITLVVTVHAIRQGFREHRAKRFTREQLEANNKFYAEAYQLAA